MLIGIRREDKNEWEARTPIVPEDAAMLAEEEGIRFVVQPSAIRTYSDEEYTGKGITVDEDLSSCGIVIAVKEIPEEFFEVGKTYIFFSHTIKGQQENMPMLKRMIELGCTLIDYEKIVDDEGRRLIFFGRHAGIAGMIETLAAAGRRFDWEGISTPLRSIEQPHRYTDMGQAMEAVQAAGEALENDGLDPCLVPFIVGFTGYGQVSLGAQEVFDHLPHLEIPASGLARFMRDGKFSGRQLYKVVFREEDMVEPAEKTAAFDLQDYYKNPAKYIPVFDRHMPALTLLVNGIYWDERYPRFVTKEHLGKNGAAGLRVIGDITCDVGGSIECNVKTTDPGNPVYVYNLKTGGIAEGVEGEGVVVLAVDNLPSEIPRDSSIHFSRTLREILPGITGADPESAFESCDLPDPVRRAVILYKGMLTPSFRYMEEYLIR